jgi:hypothetical protein
MYMVHAAAEEMWSRRNMQNALPPRDPRSNSMLPPNKKKAKRKSFSFFALRT